MSSGLPEAAYLAALASLPAMGPARLSAQLEASTPKDAWDRVAAGGGVPSGSAAGRAVVATWRDAARRTDVVDLWAQHRAAGVGVLSMASAAFPERLRDDPEPPIVLFVAGDPLCLSKRTAAIVGTRQCTRYGVDLAYELGAMLSGAGVTVVSGLARGIDAAAHSGALDAGGAPPVAVVGSGLDVPYPRENRELWRRVAEAGLVCTEAPLGAAPERWRFPARNRIIAGLAEITIVVESHDVGGSLYTAAQAIDRDRPVFAVPGPIRSAASLGCNRLVADGCNPLCEPSDALVALGLSEVVSARLPDVEVTREEAGVLDAVGWSAATLDDIVAATTSRNGPGLGRVAVVLEALVASGLVVRRGPWYERTTLSTVFHGSNDPQNPTLGATRTPPGS